MDEVRSRTDIAAVVGEQVALKTAGVGSLKGLCPFHDERSPSFTVRPAVGRYHCFGCGVDGDVISFLMELDHLSFADAVESLAARINFTLTYEDGQPQQDSANRVRLLEANRLAAEFFVAQLPTPAAAPGQQFLTERGFDERGRGALRRRLGAEVVGRADEAPEGEGVPGGGAVGRRARLERRPGRLRPLPRPAGLADPRPHRRGRRVRRQATARGRPGAEVPEHPRDRDLPQVARCSTGSTSPSGTSPASTGSWSSRATRT